MLKRLSIFVYGVLSYAVFFATYLYAIGFVGNLWVPKSMDSVRQTPFLTALLIDLGLLGLFAVQHSVMARPAFKRWWTGFVPAAAERSTYVLLSSLALIAMFIYWQPLGGVVWDISAPLGKVLLYGAFAFGWALVLVSTFLINHFDLFGLRQVWLELLGQALPAAAVRHAAVLPLRASSAVPRVVLRLLGDADHDGHASGVRARHERLHPDRDPARRARSGRRASRVRGVPPPCADAGAVHEGTAAGSAGRGFGCSLTPAGDPYAPPTCRPVR